MSNHTPGPWEFFDAKDQNGDVTISIRGDGEFIASMDLVSIGGGPFRLPDNAEANARLIAAAPELLKVCQSAASWFGELGNDDVAQGLLDDLRAAISKAEGREA